MRWAARTDTTYDADGNRLVTVDVRQGHTTYAYDALNRLAQTTMPSVTRRSITTMPTVTRRCTSMRGRTHDLHL